jgi:hypothetical protein
MIARRAAGTALLIVGAGAVAFSIVKLIKGDFPRLFLSIAGVLLVLALSLFDPPSGNVPPDVLLRSLDALPSPVELREP